MGNFASTLRKAFRKTGFPLNPFSTENSILRRVPPICTRLDHKARRGVRDFDWRGSFKANHELRFRLTAVIARRQEQLSSLLVDPTCRRGGHGCHHSGQFPNLCP